LISSRVVEEVGTLVKSVSGRKYVEERKEKRGAFLITGKKKERASLGGRDSLRKKGEGQDYGKNP